MNPEILVSTERLEHLISAGDCLVVDCRFDLSDGGKGRKDWLAGHIPGAHYAHLDDDLSAPATTRSGRHHTAAKEMLFKLSAAANAGYVELCTSPTVVDEVWWVLAKLLYEDAHGEGNWGPLPKPQKKRAFRQFHAHLIRITNLILQSTR